MKAELLSLSLAFIEGFALIISPCILPILPLVLAGSLDGSKKKPVGIILGFSLSFALFAFFSRFITNLIGLDLDTLRYAAFVLLFIFGFVLIFDVLSEFFNKMTGRLANFFTSKIQTPNNEPGFFNGLVIGSLIALVWTPCAGPILASVLIQVLLQENNWFSFLMLVAFSLGAALPMLIIAFFGFRFKENFQFFKTRTRLFRKILGFIIIITTAFLFYQEKSGNLTQFESSKASLKITKNLEDGLWQPYQSPEISGIENWLNSKPLNLNELKGKVVLIDFWAYSCINCIRTLPYLKNWFKDYKEKGLVIIGIHSPEFEFEKSLENVNSAVNRFGIEYPIALDNQFKTWRNFQNHYWPAHYLINKEGKVVYQHFGEGNYEITENNIRFLLGLNDNSPLLKTEKNYSFGQTGETYLGFNRADLNLSPNPFPTNQINSFDYPKKLNLHAWGLKGEWKILANNIISEKPKASIKIHSKATQIYAVMASVSHTPIEVSVFRNGRFIKKLKVDRSELYTLWDGKSFEESTLELVADKAGLEVYTFTFGG